MAIKIILNHLGIQCFMLLLGSCGSSWLRAAGLVSALLGAALLSPERVGVGCGRCQLSWQQHFVMGVCGRCQLSWEWLSWWGRVWHGRLCGQRDWFLAHGSLCIASICQVSLCSCTSLCFCRHHTWVFGGSLYGSQSWSSRAVDKMKPYQTRTI